MIKTAPPYRRQPQSVQRASARVRHAAQIIGARVRHEFDRVDELTSTPERNYTSGVSSMVTSNVIKLLLEGGASAAELIAAHGAAIKQRDDERRARLVALGAPVDSRAPAADVFHEQSKITAGTAPPMSHRDAVEHTLNLDYRRFPAAPQIALPAPQPLERSLGEVLTARRSVRRFDAAPVTLSELSTILALGCGVTAAGVLPKRAYPSGGGLYPIEIYTVITAVEGLESGVYHYATLEHRLEKIGSPTRVELDDAFPDLTNDAAPALLFVLSVVLTRSAAKYGERGYRFALLEAGHIAQNILLVTTALGLGALSTGGFLDDETNRLVQADAHRESALYGVLVGRTARP